MASLIDTLIDVLGQEDAEYKKLLELSNNKTKAIVGADIERLQDILVQEQAQIDAINNTTTNQIKNMTVKYSDMCRTLGIEHEGIMLAKTSYNESSIPHDIYSIDVSKFKYIEFGKLVRGIYEDTLPAFHIGIYLTNLKDEPALENVTTGKRYDVSLLNDLQFYVSYQGSGGYEVTVNYKLYNKLEETTEE